MYPYLLYLIASLLMSWLLVGAIIKLAPKLGLVDRPNERSMHVSVTPRGGGIGVVVVWAFCCFTASIVDGVFQFTGIKIVVYVLAALIIAGISLRDDFRSVGASVRFGIHIVAAVAAILLFASYDTIEVWCIIYVGKIGFLLTTIWIVGLTNVFNFMDGIDGIAGLQGLVAGLAWCIAGVCLGIPFLSFSAALLAGGCGGFLIHNWSPARIFMGDVGSAFLGFCFAVCPLIALNGASLNGLTNYTGRLPVFALMVVCPFVEDGSFTFFRRLLKREQVWKPHRSHLYQRMVQAGWSHAVVASYYGLWAVVCSIAGLHFLDTGKVVVVLSCAGLFFASTWMVTCYLERRKIVAG